MSIGARELDAILDFRYPDLSNETLALVLAVRTSGLDKASLFKALTSGGQAVDIRKSLSQPASCTLTHTEAAKDRNVFGFTHQAPSIGSVRDKHEIHEHQKAHQQDASSSPELATQKMRSASEYSALLATTCLDHEAHSLPSKPQEATKTEKEHESVPRCVEHDPQKGL